MQHNEPTFDCRSGKTNNLPARFCVQSMSLVDAFQNKTNDTKFYKNETKNLGLLNSCCMILEFSASSTYVCR